MAPTGASPGQVRARAGGGNGGGGGGGEIRFRRELAKGRDGVLPVSFPATTGRNSPSYSRVLWMVLLNVLGRASSAVSPAEAISPTERHRLRHAVAIDALVTRFLHVKNAMMQRLAANQ